MSGFHEVRFPGNIAYGATGGPEFATNDGGDRRGAREAQRQLVRGTRPVGRREWAQEPGAIDELIAFFRARRGKAYGFRFKDWTDSCSAPEMTPRRRSSWSSIPSGSVIQVRTITKPVVGTVKVYLDGVEKTSGWSVDTTTGLVTFQHSSGTGARTRRPGPFEPERRASGVKAERQEVSEAIARLRSVSPVDRDPGRHFDGIVPTDPAHLFGAEADLDAGW
jgi:Conserved hypothetical protein 2217 (DUF2460)